MNRIRTIIEKNSDYIAAILFVVMAIVFATATSTSAYAKTKRMVKFKGTTLTSTNRTVFGPGTGTPVPTPVPVPDITINLSTMPGLVNYNNIYFNRDTLHTYVYRCPANLGWGIWDHDECNTAVDTGYTFENATWRSGIDAIFHINWPWLNPLDFATQDTARALLPWIVSRTANLYPTIEWSVNDTAGAITGPFTRTTYWSVCGDDGKAMSNCFSAGQLANIIIRQHPQWARDSWIATVHEAWGR